MSLREIAQEAYDADPSMIARAEADLRAVYERDPACKGYLQPFLYFKGFLALQTYRISHWLLGQGRMPLALYLQSRVSEEFQLDINPEIDKGGLVPIASGRGHAAAIGLRQKDAVLWGGRLKPGERVTVPDGQFVHVYVARGGAQLESAGYLETGDSVRLTAAGAPVLTADPLAGNRLGDNG